MEYILVDLGIVIIAASLIGVVGYFLKQPLILAYILAGILLGPAGLGIIQDPDFINVIAEVGVILMLFLIGMEMNPERLKELGGVSLVTTLTLGLLSGAAGFFGAQLLGLPLAAQLYIGLAMVFSSTVVAVKLLYEKGDINSLYGQVSLGVLIIQDILAIVALVVLAGFKTAGFDFSHLAFIGLIGKGVFLAFGTLFITRKFFGYLYNKIATSLELLVIFSLSWCFIIALLSKTIGFSLEIGAFIAGVSLASLPYTLEISIKTKVLRDFFITIFFVSLGASVTFGGIAPFIPLIVLLSLFSLVIKPVIVMITMGIQGYDKRNSLFTGLSLANISEFSLILVAVGLSLGHLTPQVAAMITVVGALNMTLSSYLMTYSNALYKFLKPCLKWTEIRKVTTRMSSKKKRLKKHIVLLGCGQMGRQILEQVRNFKEDYVVVDHDNRVIRELIEKKATCIFGDVEDEELLNELDLKDAEIIISTLPNPEDHFLLLRRLSRIPVKKRPIVIATAASGREGITLFDAGADYVILKHSLGAEHVHQINRELYDLKEGQGGVRAAAQKTEKKRMESDADYVQLLHNLNRLRLAEIKQMIGRKDLKLIAQK